MGIISQLTTNASRSLFGMFPSFFSGTTKHDYAKDYGWPEQLQFEHFLQKYRRNGLARAGVDKTIAKTWESDPVLYETEKAQETDLEKEIRLWFDDIRLWNVFAEADRRSMVGGYAGVILRFADNMQFDQPLGRVPGGLQGLVGAIPCWKSQLVPAEYDSDINSPNYGLPSMYTYNEASLVEQEKTQGRAFRVHPSRVIIWSDDGTINCRSDLEPGFNDLIDAEKVKGAGAEGFWKTSRGAPVIEAAQGVSQKTVADSMGVKPAELMDAINGQIESFNQGFDKGLMLGGFTAKPLQINLPDPKEFFDAPVQLFAASLNIPVKILLGSQTGERASTEDANEWNRTNNSRRVNRNKPLIRAFVNLLEECGVLAKRQWTVHWDDLTDASPSEKLERAAKMSQMNRDSSSGMLTFAPEEIREAAGFEADSDYDLEDVEDDPPPADPADPTDPADPADPKS